MKSADEKKPRVCEAFLPPMGLNVTYPGAPPEGLFGLSAEEGVAVLLGRNLHQNTNRCKQSPMRQRLRMAPL